MKIKANINIAKLVEKHPDSIEILMKHGLGCVGCMMSTGESLEEGAKAHGLSDKKIAKMVEEINKTIV